MTARSLIHTQKCDSPPKMRTNYPTGIFCAYCGEELDEGDRYLTNEDGETVHYYCLNGIDDLIEFMNIEVETAALYYGEEDYDV